MLLLTRAIGFNGMILCFERGGKWKSAAWLLSLGQDGSGWLSMVWFSSWPSKIFICKALCSISVRRCCVKGIGLVHGDSVQTKLGPALTSMPVGRFAASCSSFPERQHTRTHSPCWPWLFRKNRIWQIAAAVLDSAAGISIDTVLCNAALDAYARAGAWLQACSLFHKMCRMYPKQSNRSKGKGSKPDEISSSTLLATCERASQWKPQLAILRFLAVLRMFHLPRAFCLWTLYRAFT